MVTACTTSTIVNYHMNNQLTWLETGIINFFKQLQASWQQLLPWNVLMMHHDLYMQSLSTVDQNHTQLYQQYHQQWTINEVNMDWYYFICNWGNCNGDFNWIWRWYKGGIFNIYSSRTRNPGVLTHNFEVMTVTLGLWNIHQKYFYRCASVVSCGSIWHNPQSYAT